MRAALDHLARDPDFRLARVEAILLAPAAWVLRLAAVPGALRLMFRGSPIPRRCRSCRRARSRSTGRCRRAWLARTGGSPTARARPSRASTIILSCTSPIATPRPAPPGPTWRCRPRPNRNSPHAAGLTTRSSPGATSSCRMAGKWRTPGRVSSRTETCRRALTSARRDRKEILKTVAHVRASAANRDRAKDRIDRYHQTAQVAAPAGVRRLHRDVVAEPGRGAAATLRHITSRDHFQRRSEQMRGAVAKVVGFGLA